MPTTHAILGPSTASRWLTCPGSVPMSRHAGGTGGGRAASEGTLAHTVAEACARREALGAGSIPVMEALNAVRDAYPGSEGYVRGSEMAHHGTAYGEAIAALAEELEETTQDSVEVHLEEQVQTGIPHVWGTADAVLVSHGGIVVVDYKYGKHIAVSAEDNPQLRLYGLGALHDYGPDLHDDAEVTMVVIQPRCGGVSLATELAGDLRRWGEEVVRPRAALALSGDGELHPSEDACRWCPARSFCGPSQQFKLFADFGDEPTES